MVAAAEPEAGRARGAAEHGVGGGIMASPAAEGEYDAARAGSVVLRRRAPEFELLETLRLEEGEYVRLDRHLARLGASAAYFGWADPVAAAREAMVAHARKWPRGVRRVRVLADRRGDVRVESTEFDGPGSVPMRRPDRDGTEEARTVGTRSDGPGSTVEAAHPLPVRLARRPVSRDDIFLYHKTTHRATYEAHAAEFPECFDVLLWNEDGELTEFTRGNLVVEIDGVRWTPPRECGLLPGTFREELLERGEIEERVLHPVNLPTADRIWLINSLREWVQVGLVE